jgi:predicted transcriptional regulator
MEGEVRERVIRVLEQFGRDGVSQGELVEVTGYSKSWISEVLKELERCGLVARVPGPGRSKRVVLSKYLDPAVGRVVRVAVVRASEYLYLPNFVGNLRREGYAVELVLYGNVSEATAAVARGDVHLAITPIYTQAAYRALGAPLRTYPGGALGGASIVYRGELGPAVLSSRASTMEVAAVATYRYLRMEVGEFRYYVRPEEGVERFVRGEADAVAIWEPYASYLEDRGYRRLRPAELLGEYHCCTLTRHENLSQEAERRVRSAWAKALEEVRRGAVLEGLDELLGLDRASVERARREYRFTEELAWENVKSLLSYASGFLLNYTTVRELLER